jgi:hypothetical protein
MLDATAYNAATFRFPTNMSCISVPSYLDDDRAKMLESLLAESLPFASGISIAGLIPAPLTLTPERLVNPSVFLTDESLDWDTFIAVPPPRLCGTLAVTLKYAGRKGPSPIEDPWD